MPESIAQLRAQFNQYVNMTAEEMRSWYATPESDFASMPPVLALKLGQKSGKTMGKTALALKEKSVWSEVDAEQAREIVRKIKFNSGRSAALYREKDGEQVPTAFHIALKNRGHDAERFAATSIEPAPDDTAQVAEALSASALREKLSRALDVWFDKLTGGKTIEFHRPWIEEYFPLDREMVFEWEGSLFRMPFDVEGSNIALQTEGLIEVENAFVPVTTQGELQEIREADDGKKVWRIKIMRAGQSYNGNIYPASVLERAVQEGKFEGKPGYNRSDDDHLKEAPAPVSGYVSNVTFDAANGWVLGDYTWEPVAYPAFFEKRFQTSIAEGKPILPEFSVTGKIRRDPLNPMKAAEIVEIRSIDPVSFASAGGEVISIAEAISHHNTTGAIVMDEKLKDQILALVNEPGSIKSLADLQAKLKGDNIAEGALATYVIDLLKEKKPTLFEKQPGLEKKLAADEELLVFFISEYLQPAGEKKEDKPADPPANPGAPPPTPVAEAKVDPALVPLYNNALRGMLAGTQLSEPAREFLMKRFGGKPFEESDVQEAISDMLKVAGANAPETRVKVTKDEADNLRRIVNDFFSQNSGDSAERTAIREAQGDIISKHESDIQVRSVKGLFEKLLGITDFSLDGLADIAEAMDTTLANRLLVEGMNTRTVYRYRNSPAFMTWKSFTRITPKFDFKTNEAVGMGGFSGFGDIDSAGAGTGYPTITEVGAAAETYAILLKGGIFTLSIKHIRNDDVEYMAGMPDRLGDLAARVNSYFAWNMLRSSNALSDGKALVHADHNNSMTDALAEAALETAVGMMMGQQYPNSTDPMVTIPKYLWTSISIAQQKTAASLVTPGYGMANNTPTFMQDFGIQRIINPHEQDLDVWGVHADPTTNPVLEIGFLDGKQNPTIIAADKDGIGRMFTHAEAQYKIVHDYNGAPIGNAWKNLVVSVPV